MASTKTVFVLPSWYPPDGGSFFKEQTEVLAEVANQVVLYPQSVSVKKLLRSPIKEAAQLYRITHDNDTNVPTLKLPYIIAPKLFRVNILCQYICFRILFARATRLYGTPDILHVHSSIWAGFSAYKISKKFGTPYIITEHRGRFVNNSYARKEKQLPKSFESYLTKIFSNASFIAPVSNPMIPKIRSYIDQTVAIESKPNLVNTNIFEKTKKQQVKASQFTFVTVSALVNLKGIDVLLKAFAEVLKETSDNLELMIIGDGPERTRLENLVEELQIRQSITFKGQQGRSDVARLLAQSHVFVLPTRYEAFGVVLVEALMAGMPVLATRNSGGPDSIVTPGINGYLFDIDNITQLKDLMIDVYSTYDKWNLTRIAASARQGYGPEAFMRQYKELYAKVSGSEPKDKGYNEAL